MFTGIVESVGIVIESFKDGTNQVFRIQSPISDQFKIDQSISHNGICLTVEQVINDTHQVTAIEETLSKTNCMEWGTGSLINLERALQFNGRLDGHLVQGHVDAVADCIFKIEKEGSWEYEFAFPKKFGELIIEKGSVCVNGISLTAFNVTKKSFRVAVIPYTYEHTNIKEINEGDRANIEFDMIGKYVLRKLSLKH